MNAEVDSTNFKSDFESDPQYFNENLLSVVDCGIAQDISFGTGGPLPGLSWYEVNTTIIAVVYQGHFVVPQTGDYTWTSESKTFGYIWTGDVAYSAWSGSNWVANQNTPSKPQYYTAGELIPTTVLYANTGGNSTCSFSLIFPDGNIHYIFGDYFVRPFENDTFSPTSNGSCPNAPEFDPFTMGSSCVSSSRPYSLYHVGSSTTFSGTSPTGFKQVYQGNITACQAAASCMDYSYATTYPNTLDLHYLKSQSAWECIGWGDNNQDPRAYSVINEDVIVGYGLLSKGL